MLTIVDIFLKKHIIKTKQSMSIISLSHSLILFDFNSKYFRFQDTAYQGLSIVYFILFY